MGILSATGLLLAIALAIQALRQIRILPPRSAARVIVILLIAAAAALVAFAWWGQYAAAGRRAFDEMDGLYPFAAGVLGVLLTVAAALAAWWMARRGRPR